MPEIKTKCLIPDAATLERIMFEAKRTGYRLGLLAAKNKRLKVQYDRFFEVRE